MDIFDIIGPVMVGPSNSHTAAAVRIYIPEVDGRTDKGSKYFAVWFFS